MLGLFIMPLLRIVIILAIITVAAVGFFQGCAKDEPVTEVFELPTTVELRISPSPESFESFESYERYDGPRERQMFLDAIKQDRSLY